MDHAEKLRLLQIERELWRRKCRSSLTAWAVQALAPEDQAPARHHRLLCDKLEALSRGDIERLMVLMPPGHAKSTYVSRIFLTWWFTQHPRSAVIAASNNSDLAESFGRKAKNLVTREQRVLGYRLNPDSKAAGRWETTTGGEYYAAGINGGNGTTITGRRLDLGIIDDPVSKKSEAMNESLQNKIMDWYRTEFYTRMKPGGRIVLVMTRWAEIDLGGKLLDEMGSGGDRWEVLSLPAIAEDPALSTEEDPILPDALGRMPGEALWPEEWPVWLLDKRKTTVGPLDWNALFQQRPKPPQGILFDVTKITTIDVPNPADVTEVIRSWDVAATAQAGSNDPDWTVGVKLARLRSNRYVVLDVRRERLPPQGVEELIATTAEQDGHSVRIRIPEDPGAGGKTQAASYVGRLAGYMVETTRETTSKVERATPVISQCNVGNLMMTHGTWNRGFTSELRDFPGGRKDDQVDALSAGFELIALGTPRLAINTATLSADLARLTATRGLSGGRTMGAFVRSR